MTSRSARIRGRSATTWSTGIAVGVAATIGFATRHYLVPSTTTDYAVAVIWGIALVAGVLGLGSAFLQARRLTREWKALEQLRTGDLQATVEHLRSRDPLQKLVVLEHAMAVATVLRTDDIPRLDFRDQWRRRNIERTSTYGAIQRFLASGLLLLAVLGTFAGLKSALPCLSSAIGRASGPTGRSLGNASDCAVSNHAVRASQPEAQGSVGARTEEVTSALDLVANAFGANFLALLGSLVLGAASFGLYYDRRELVSALENVAAESWYPQMPREAGVSSLDRAVLELRDSSIGISKVGGEINALSRRLEDFRTSMNEALDRMTGDMRASLNARTAAEDRRQETQLAELSRTLGLVTRALERTAVGYEGLVKGLEERDLGIGSAAQSLDSAARQLIATGASLETSTKNVITQRGEVLQRDAELRGEIRLIIEALRNSGQEVARAAASQAVTLGKAVGSVETIGDDVTGSLRILVAAVGAVRSGLTEHGERLALQLPLLETIANRSTSGVDVMTAVRGELAGLRDEARLRLQTSDNSSATRHQELVALAKALESALARVHDGISSATTAVDQLQQTLSVRDQHQAEVDA